MSELICKYLSNTELATLRILKQSISNKLVNLTCIGLYNHGKSSLLNVLIEDFKDSTFKTADIRETTTSLSFEHDGINYIDTPGLNAKEHDDKRVFDSIKESDINLFVHTVTTGEFIEKEIEFLHKIKNNWQNPEEFIYRTIFVLSRIDKANNNEDINNTINKMQLQINEIFGFEALIIPASAKRYCQGINEGKYILRTKSNVESLKTSINKLKEKYLDSILETRKFRLKNTYDGLIAKYEAKRQDKLFELSKQKQAQEKFLTSLHQDINQIESTLEKMYDRLGE